MLVFVCLVAKILYFLVFFALCYLCVCVVFIFSEPCLVKKLRSELFVYIIPVLLVIRQDESYFNWNKYDNVNERVEKCCN